MYETPNAETLNSKTMIARSQQLFSRLKIL
jgi:hypothetical protein